MQKNFVKIENSKDWQNLLDKVLFKTFFHYIEWEEFLEKQFKWLKFERYNYKDIALLSLARVGNKLISHPFCEYGGPLPLADNINGEKFKEDLFAEFDKDILKISFHPFSARMFLAPAGERSVLAPSGRIAYFVEGSLDLRKTTRHEIEKAQENGIQIEKCQSQNDLNAFYGLCVKSAKSHRVPVYPISFFNYFLHSPNSEIILAKNKGLVIAGAVFLFYDKLVHYFQSAIDPKRKNSGATHLILWRQIQKCLASNKVFDFGGTRIGSPLQIFKKGWGGKEWPIFELANQRFDLPRRSNLKILRNIFGILPPFLVEKLSPYLLKYKL